MVDISNRSAEPAETDSSSACRLPAVHAADPPASPSRQSLKTSKLINIPPLLPATLKLSNEFSSTNVSPSKPKPPSNVMPPWEPGAQVQLPPTLRFESWWFEGGQRCTMHISYDTDTKLCTASMKVAVHGCVSAQGVVPYAQRQMEAWDLHVGARLNLLGKQVTLRKASDTATLTWLDTQAAALIRDKAALQKELEKYRPVATKAALHSEQQRSAVLEAGTNGTHEQLPTGGRTNLRNLRHHVEQLVAAVRQHQRLFPRIRSVVAADLVAAAEGPDNWSVPAASDRSDSPSGTGGPGFHTTSTSGGTAAKRRSSRPGAAPSSSHDGGCGGGNGGVRLNPISMDAILSVPLAASAAGLTKLSGTTPGGIKSPESKLSRVKSRSRLLVDTAPDSGKSGSRALPYSPKPMKPPTIAAAQQQQPSQLGGEPRGTSVSSATLPPTLDPTVGQAASTAAGGGAVAGNPVPGGGGNGGGGLGPDASTMSLAMAGGPSPERSEVLLQPPAVSAQASGSVGRQSGDGDSGGGGGGGADTSPAGDTGDESLPTADVPAEGHGQGLAADRELSLCLQEGVEGVDVADGVTEAVGASPSYRDEEDDEGAREEGEQEEAGQEEGEEGTNGAEDGEEEGEEHDAGDPHLDGEEEEEAQQREEEEAEGEDEAGQEEGQEEGELGQEEEGQEEEGQDEEGQDEEGQEEEQDGQGEGEAGGADAEDREQGPEVMEGLDEGEDAEEGQQGEVGEVDEADGEEPEEEEAEDGELEGEAGAQPGEEGGEGGGSEAEMQQREEGEEAEEDAGSGEGQAAEKDVSSDKGQGEGVKAAADEQGVEDD